MVCGMDLQQQTCGICAKCQAGNFTYQSIINSATELRKIIMFLISNLKKTLEHVNWFRIVLLFWQWNDIFVFNSSTAILLNFLFHIQTYVVCRPIEELVKKKFTIPFLLPFTYEVIKIWEKTVLQSGKLM